jgi:hypothetical protein
LMRCHVCMLGPPKTRFSLTSSKQEAKRGLRVFARAECSEKKKKKTYNTIRNRLRKSEPM